MYLRLGLSFWSSCPYLSNAGNIDMFHLHLEWCLTEVIAVGIQVIRYKNHLMFLIDVFYYSCCVWALLSYVYVARRECCTFGADVTGSCKPLGMGSGTWTWSSRTTVRAGNYQGQISSLSPPPPHPPFFLSFLRQAQVWPSLASNLLCTWGWIWTPVHSASFLKCWDHRHVHLLTFVWDRILYGPDWFRTHCVD